MATPAQTSTEIRITWLLSINANETNRSPCKVTNQLSRCRTTSCSRSRKAKTSLAFFVFFLSSRPLFAANARLEERRTRLICRTRTDHRTGSKMSGADHASAFEIRHPSALESRMQILRVARHATSPPLHRSPRAIVFTYSDESCIFRPTMPMMISDKNTSRVHCTLSWNARMPSTATPTAPIPAHTA
jgi:hypothetical protein